MASEEGYALQFKDEAKSQLRLLPGLSRRERVRLFLSLHRRLSRLPDAFRDDSANRTGPGPTEIVWPLIFPSDNGDPLKFIFVVDVRAAVHGVLEILSVQLAGP